MRALSLVRAGVADRMRAARSSSSEAKEESGMAAARGNPDGLLGQGRTSRKEKDGKTRWRGAWR